LLRYVARRLLVLLPVLLGVSVLVFVLIHLAPGDPITTMLGVHARTPGEAARLRHLLGLDQPLPVQYVKWLGRVVRGDFGDSLYAHVPVIDLIAERLPLTLELTLVSMVLSVAVGIPFGVLSATRKDSLIDNLGRVLAMVGVSMPVFWLGLLLIIVFALRLGVLPPGGSVADHGPVALVLPSVTLAASFTAIVVRLTRSSVLEVLGEDYVRTAHAKGLPPALVSYRHALSNALIPVVTVVGLQTGTLLSGAVLTETIFALPGLGRLMVDAVGARDYPLVLASVLFVAVVYVVLNLLVDVTYALLDPRVRYR
jgi:peptide/nickel transport system permease protein